MKRTLVIGDIHGAVKALIQVLQRADYDSKTDNLIFLGDYVDGWGESAEVIDFILGLKKKNQMEMRHPDSIICIEGNHDQWFREFLSTGKEPQGWTKNGGKTTIDSYSRFAEAQPNREEAMDAHLKFLRDMKLYHVDNKNRAFVHAGCNMVEGVAATLEYLMVWDRSTWRSALSGGRIHAHSELFIGHTTTCAQKLKKHMPEFEIQTDGKDYVTVPMNRQNIWNLDTGGGWSGKLTAMDIDSKEFWQSDFCFDLYPHEKGRN
tara:strand:- start:451 stop:1236 length:786 start_codon:yes stop_codon:yes gene_type:complete